MLPPKMTTNMSRMTLVICRLIRIALTYTSAAATVKNFLGNYRNLKDLYKQ